MGGRSAPTPSVSLPVRWSSFYGAISLFRRQLHRPDKGGRMAILRITNERLKDVRALQGGMNEWVNAGYPMEPK